MAEFTVEDFSGGETDKWRNNNDPRFYKEAKNMYITEQRTLETRPGYKPADTTQRPYGSAQKVEKVWHHITRRSTVGSGNPDWTRYQTFISANKAVKVSESTDTDWKDIETTEGNNLMDYRSSLHQGNYVRINDNEFVMVPRDNAGYPKKFFRTGSGGQWKYVALGLPRYDDVISAVSDGLGSNNWSYALVLKHEYETFEPGAGFVTKIVRGAPAFTDILEDVGIATITTPDFDGNLGDWVDNEGGTVAGEDFDFTNVVVELYRTKTNGSVWYKRSEVSPGAVFIDNLSDASLESGEILYTTGGVLPNGMTSDRPLFGTWANNALWLFSSSRGWQSKVGILDAHPGSFNFRVREGEQITGCSTIDIYPIVGTRQGIYRIEGIVDDLGNGTHRVRTVSEEHGCLSNRTMVRAKNRIFFWSDDGIYETNGYQAKKISGVYDTRYNQIVNRVFTDGIPFDSIFTADSAYDVDNERVMWVYANTNSAYNRAYIMLHLDFKNEEGYAITSGEFNHDVISVSAANGRFFLTTEDGSVLTEDPDRANDAPSSSGGPNGNIDWTYETCSLSFGTRRVAKWFTRIFLTFQGRGTPLSVRVQEDTDESGSFRDLNNIEEPTKSSGQFLLKRWFRKGRIRGKYKQLKLLNAVSAVDEKVELTDLTIEYGSGGEGVTQSDRT